MGHLCVDDCHIYVRLMHGTSLVIITRHVRTKISRINGASDAFCPPDDARKGRHRGPLEHTGVILIAVTVDFLGANAGFDV